jgi:hypothetical protein
MKSKMLTLPSRIMKHLALLLIFIVMLLISSSCILPYKITEGTPVYAVCDYLHCGVIIHEKTPENLNKFTFYSFIDINWYLDGNTGSGDFFNALFSKAPSALEVGTYEGEKELHQVIGQLAFWQIPDGWLFPIPKENLQNGYDFLERDVLGNEGELIDTKTYRDWSYEYYRAEQSYTMFLNCVNLSAYILQAMGVNIRASWYIYTNEIMRGRLNRLTDMISFEDMSNP